MSSARVNKLSTAWTHTHTHTDRIADIRYHNAHLRPAPNEHRFSWMLSDPSGKSLQNTARRAKSIEFAPNWPKAGYAWPNSHHLGDTSGRILGPHSVGFAPWAEYRPTSVEVSPRLVERQRGCLMGPGPSSGRQIARSGVVKSRVKRDRPLHEPSSDDPLEDRVRFH